MNGPRVPAPAGSAYRSFRSPGRSPEHHRQPRACCRRPGKRRGLTGPRTARLPVVRPAPSKARCRAGILPKPASAPPSGAGTSGRNNCAATRPARWPETGSARKDIRLRKLTLPSGLRPSCTPFATALMIYARTFAVQARFARSGRQRAGKILAARVFRPQSFRKREQGRFGGVSKLHAPPPGSRR